MGKLRGVVAAVAVSVGVSAAALVPSVAGAKSARANSAPGCGDHFKLSTAFGQGATQGLMLIATTTYTGKGPCVAGGGPLLTLQRRVDGKWQKVMSGGSFFYDVFDHGTKAVVAYKWSNWCGSRTDEFRLVATTLSKMSATSKVLTGKTESSTLPKCVDASKPTKFVYVGVTR